MLERPRRNRHTPAIRDLVQETRLHASDLIYPIFIQEGQGSPSPIHSMPGVCRYPLNRLSQIAEQVMTCGIQGVALFPVVPDHKKNPLASEALSPDNLMCQAARQLRSTHPSLTLFGDVALDPYSSDGHDGLVKEGQICNDDTIDILAQMAVILATAGIDCVSPSDMMDGRVEAIRKRLDANGFTSTSICSYTAKYASAFYGPFREALESAPKKGDKKTYQMNPANRIEAMREARLDAKEGADILMVKPAGAYLDIISDLKKSTDIPVFAYQVSGEYSMIRLAGNHGIFDYKDAMLESVVAIKRAGADVIITYAALEIADWL